jgi:putative transposase
LIALFAILATGERKPSIPFKWKAKYGGLEVSELVRVRELESENSRLKRMYAELALENEAIKGLLKKL